MAKSRRDTADYYTLKARREGYPARSVYKLEQIQKQNRIIRQGDCVLDVGAAPGSWTLYVHREILKGNGKITAVDLNPLSLNPLPPTVTAFTGDAFTPEMKQQLLSCGPFNAIISDAAPMTTGNRTVDTARSSYLAEQVILLAQDCLKEHGNLVVKIFQGDSVRQLLGKLKELFVKTKTLKPEACRADSFETYLIGLDFCRTRLQTDLQTDQTKSE